MQQYLDFALHHSILFIALAVLIVLMIANELHGNMTGGKRVSPTAAVRLINDQDPVIIDLRNAADYKRGHLLNAVNIPPNKIEERITEFSKKPERPVLLYCNLGNSSREAALKLLKKGYPNTYELKGGMNGWLGANLPVTAK